jgi:hypothetical protein
MAIFDWDGNFVKDSPDGKDYFLSQDGMVAHDYETGAQVDSNGNVAFGDWGTPDPPPAPPAPRWRPAQVQQYRPPNFDIRLWRG